MNVSRRGFAGLAAALPFAGNAVARDMAAKHRDAMMMQGQTLAGNQIGVGYPETGPAPKMEHWQAMRLALQDPDIRREVLSECYARQRVIHMLDPDIANKRSWSDMAKITFQRQRNVERELESMTQANHLGFAGKLLQNFIQKAMFG